MTLGELSIVLGEDISDILETISIMELMGKLINVGGIFRKCGDSCRSQKWPEVPQIASRDKLF